MLVYFRMVVGCFFMTKWRIILFLALALWARQSELWWTGWYLFRFNAWSKPKPLVMTKCRTKARMHTSDRSMESWHYMQHVVESPSMRSVFFCWEPCQPFCCPFSVEDICKSECLLICWKPSAFKAKNSYHGANSIRVERRWQLQSVPWLMAFWVHALWPWCSLHD